MAGPVNLNFTGGATVLANADLSSVGLSDSEHSALSRLIASGDFNALAATDQTALQDKKFLVNAGNAEALICRFDLSCVRID